MIKYELLQIILEPILNLNVGFVWSRKGVRLFGLTIP